MTDKSVAIIGGGPAGLSAAYELTRLGVRSVMFEKTLEVGGIARTEIYKDYYFDIGGHRFYTNIKDVQRLWQEMLGDKFLKVSRISHIYYGGRFFAYPLDFFNTFLGLGFLESLLILISYCKNKALPYREERTSEQWLCNRFGRRLYTVFFKNYTEKVWGIPCKQMPIDWVVQRIKGLSFVTALSNSLFSKQTLRTLVPEFYYPLKGPGMMWNELQKAITTGGGQIRLNSEVISCKHEASIITSIRYRESGKTIEMPIKHLISSAPITQLVAQLAPKAPGPVLEAARRLSYRALVVVILIVDKKDVFPGQWIYVHDPDVKVGRIQNFKNWSQAMVPDPQKTSVGMEYFCNEGDNTWNLPDHEMVELASLELSKLGFARVDDVIDTHVVRQAKAYPIYDMKYKENLRVIQDFLGTFNNLQSIGRNGMHRYNNMDHSMYTGMLAARNILGANFDLWSNDDDDYIE